MDSSAPYYRRQAAALAALALALGGCSAAGDATGDRTFSARAVPFTFLLPADFTKAAVDQLNSRGDVVAGAGIDKLDVIAVRRIPAARRLPGGPIAHRVRGVAVTSTLHRVPIPGWAIECQWTAARRARVLVGCREAVASARAIQILVRK